MKYNEKDALRAAQIVFCDATKAVKLERGFSHDIYEIETNSYPEKVIVRFANDNDKTFGIAKEIRINKILEELGIPVVKMILHDDSKKIIQSEFVIMSKSEGEDLDTIWDKLSDKEKEQIVEKMGNIIGKIHSVKFSTFGSLTPDGIYSLSKFSLKEVGKIEKSNPFTKEFFAGLFSDLGILASFNFVNPEFILALNNYFLKNKSLSETDEEPALIHGDIYPQNFKVKKIKNEWFITCLFDFEYGAAYMREYDFLKLHRIGFLEKGNIRNALLKGYTKFQNINENFDKRVKYFRISRDVGFAHVLLGRGDKKFAEKVLNELKEKIDFSGKVLSE